MRAENDTRGVVFPEVCLSPEKLVNTITALSLYGQVKRSHSSERVKLELTRTELALGLVDEAKKTTQEITNPAYKELALSEISSNSISVDSSTGKKNAQINSRNNFLLLEEVDTKLKMGLVDDARADINKFNKDDICLEFALLKLVEYEARNGLVDEAETTFFKLRETGVKEFYQVASLYIAQAKVRLGLSPEEMQKLGASFIESALKIF